MEYFIHSCKEHSVCRANEEYNKNVSANCTGCHIWEFLYDRDSEHFKWYMKTTGKTIEDIAEEVYEMTGMKVAV